MHPAVTAPARASAPVMSAEEPVSRRAALLGLGALIAAPMNANAVPKGAVPIWKVDKKGLGYKKGPPDGAKKCTVAKPCAAGAGLKWDPKALGVAKGEGGTSTRTFLKTKTYANSPY